MKTDARSGRSASTNGPDPVDPARATAQAGRTAADRVAAPEADRRRSGGGQPGGSGNGTGSGPGNGSGLDMSQIDTVTGEVVDFTGHAGSGQPIVTLDVDGEVYEITVSPYHPSKHREWSSNRV